jgi:hypothetical protein
MSSGDKAPQRIALDGGSCEISLPVANVVYWQLEGNCPADLADLLTPHLLEVIHRTGSLYFFVDATRMKNYDGGFRDRLVAFFKTHRPSVKGLHVLHASALVQMGLAIANAALGFVNGYRDHSQFEAAIEAACGRGVVSPRKGA